VEQAFQVDSGLRDGTPQPPDSQRTRRERWKVEKVLLHYTHGHPKGRTSPTEAA
jgi:hypothetical protein